MERRYFELRQTDGRRLSGVAVRFGDIARLPWGEERIAPGAFTPLGDVILNAQHDRGRPLARTGGGGLELLDDGRALTIEADLPATREADDTLELVKSKVLRGLSIEFRAVAERMEGKTRIIERAELHAVAVVDSPAYPQSEIQARMKAIKPERRRTRRWQ